MTTHPSKVHTQRGSAADEIFSAGERMNQLLIENLDPAAWTSKLPLGLPGHTRTIAAVFTHMHNTA